MALSTRAMMIRSNHMALRFLTATLLLIKAVLPGSSALAHSAGFDISLLFCAPAAQVTTEMREEAALLLSLMEDGSDEKPTHAPCAFCTLCDDQSVLETPSAGGHLRVKSTINWPLFGAVIGALDGGSPYGPRAPPYKA